jgi:rod shape-determining protein MreC
MPEISLSRQRPWILLTVVVLAQVLLLAFQIKREHDVRLIRFWAAEFVTPFERFGTWSLSKVGGVWGGYVGLRGARAENASLHQEVAYLRLRNRELETQALEAQRLGTLLNFQTIHAEAPMLAAQVIGASADPGSHTLVLNRGEHDHVRRNMAVINPDGIVGKIVDVFPNTSQVLLLDDKDSGVGALLADTRTHGVVKGSGDPALHMDYVVNEEKVHDGEMVLTSGEDRIFPKGLFVGTISGASQGNPFQIIRIRPAARLDRLEDVVILLTLQDLKGNSQTVDSNSSAPSGVVQTGALQGAPIAQAAKAPEQSTPAPAAQTQPSASGQHK